MNRNDSTVSTDDLSISKGNTSGRTTTLFYSQWFRLANQFFHSMEKAFGSLENLSQIIFETLSKHHSKALAQYSTMLDSIIDKTEDRLIDVFNQEATRLQIHFERLSLDEYSQLIELIQSFTDKDLFPLRKTFSTSSNLRPLKTFLQGQTTKFLNYFHEDRKQRLLTTLDNEQWKQVSSSSHLSLSLPVLHGSVHRRCLFLVQFKILLMNYSLLHHHRRSLEERQPIPMVPKF